MNIRTKIKLWFNKMRELNSFGIVENWKLLPDRFYIELPEDEIQKLEKEEIARLREKIKDL